MPWIRIQGLKTDNEGRITAGTATIVDTEYVAGKIQHSKQSTREKLGRPLKLASDHRSGIFKSKEGGIVSYDADTDKKEILDIRDPRLEGLIERTDLRIHTVFGDAYLFLDYLKNIGMTAVLNQVFSQESDLQRCIAHLFHAQMRNCSRDRCDLFIKKSFMSHVVKDVTNSSLSADTRFFDLLGDDKIRMGFFQTFTEHMKRTEPDFGKCCFVDSSPLPNDIDDNPFNAFASHGESGIQCRLVLVTDIASGMPVWFKVIPGNVLDVNTLKNVTDDVKMSLGIEVCQYVLDAGYASEALLSCYSLGDAEGTVVRLDSKGKEVRSVVIRESKELTEYEIPAKTIVVKMPFRKGYGHLDMFDSVKELLNNGKYDFVREKHAYFGKRREVCLFKKRMFAYIFVDHNNALQGYRDYMSKHSDEFEELKDKEKTWKKYSSGFFVLLSNIREEPKVMLDRYFGRCFIETIFKTAKEYLRLLPLKKWTAQRVYGKMLCDMISTIIYLNMRKTVKDANLAITDIATITQSLMCSCDNGIVRIDPPNKQVKDVYKTFGISLPYQFTLDEYVSDRLGKCSAR